MQIIGTCGNCGGAVVANYETGPMVSNIGSELELWRIDERVWAHCISCGSNPKTFGPVLEMEDE